MKLLILFLICLSVRLDESGVSEIDNKSLDTNVNKEALVPRELKEYDTEEDKRKLSLIAQNMAKSLNLQSNSPYSITSQPNLNNMNANNMLNLQQLQGRISRQLPL